MTNPNFPRTFPKTPDFSPMLRLVAMQTRFAIETSQGMMKLALLPWSGMPLAIGNLCAPKGAAVRTSAEVADTGAETAVETPAEPVEDAETVADSVTETVVETGADVADAVEETTETVTEAVTDSAVETFELSDEAPAAPVAEAPAAEMVAAPVAEVTAEPASDAAVQPPVLDAPKGGTADDLTRLKGAGPKLDRLLRSMGYFHFEQIAAWTPAEVAWIDENLQGFKGRATRDDWVGQAKALLAEKADA